MSDKLIKELSNLLSDFEQLKQQVNQLQKQVESRPEQQWFAIKEVSRITGLTVLALKGRHKRHTLNFVREGNCLLMNVTDLDNLLQQLQEKRERNRKLHYDTLKHK